MFSRFFRRKAANEEIEPVSVPERANRDSEYIHVQVLTRSKTKLEGIIVDLSGEGACVRFISSAGLAVGDAVKLRSSLRNIDETAQVIWRDQNQVGLRFV